MEFEKLRDIIVEVLNVDETEVTMEFTCPRGLWELCSPRTHLKRSTGPFCRMLGNKK